MKARALLLLVGLLLVPLSGVIFATDGETDEDQSPNLIIGIVTGLNYHSGRALEVDAQSGASKELDESVYSDSGMATGGFVDFSLVDIGPGNFGLLGSFYYSFPDIYYDIGLVPRYRMIFALPSATAPTIEPWIGPGAWLTFKDKIDKNYYVLFGASLGCDLQLFTPGIYLGLGADAELANPVPVYEDVIVAGEKHTLERRINNFTGLLRVSYRFF